MAQPSSAVLMTLDSWQQWEGRVLGGRYVLCQHLGGSDYTAVFVTEFGGARAVAKLISAEAPDSAAQLARWEAACNVAHPHLLRVYDTGRWHADDERDMFFAVTEFADENLGEVLADRPLTLAEAREMLAPTLAALEYLHERNLVHGFLKPSNVRAVGPQLKLAVDSVRRAGTRLTRVEQEDSRAVPEVFNAGLSWRNDIWALGLLLVESLTRQKPKIEKTGGVAQIPADMLEPFKSIAQACLQRDPAKRCSIAEVRRMLERPVESTKPQGEVVPIRVESNPKLEPQPERVVVPATAKASVGPESTTVDAETHLYEGEPPKDRNRRLVLLAVSILLAVIAVVALFRLGRPRPSEMKSQPEVVAPITKPADVQPSAPTTSGTQVKSASGAVMREVMPEVSRVAQNSIHGVVKVRVQVNVDEGDKVTLAGLSAHGPSRYFARQALEAARQWTFSAPVVNGKPVASRWMVEFDFRRSGVKTESKLMQPKG